jgi:hypothetical protein
MMGKSMVVVTAHAARLVGYRKLEQGVECELVLRQKLLSELLPLQQQLLWPTSWLVFMRQLVKDLVMLVS